MFDIYNKNSSLLEDVKDESIDSIVTEPPYGISYQNNYWDKDLPDKVIWENCFKKIKSGDFGLVFSSIRLIHRLMVDLEDSGFVIKDVLFWSYLNGMPKSRNVGLLIDKEFLFLNSDLAKFCSLNFTKLLSFTFSIAFFISVFSIFIFVFAIVYSVNPKGEFLGIAYFILPNIDSIISEQHIKFGNFSSCFNI